MSRAKTVSWWKTELSFNTKKDLESAIRKVVNGMPLNTPMNAKATVFFTKILQHHHEFTNIKRVLVLSISKLGKISYIVK